MKAIKNGLTDEPLGEVMGGQVKKVIAAAARHITAWACPACCSGIWGKKRREGEQGELSSYELGSWDRWDSISPGRLKHGAR